MMCVVFHIFRSTKIIKGWKEAHAAARMTETFRNWVLFHFHFQQALLKMYDEPLSCAPVQTWIPRGQRLLGDINNRHARYTHEP